MQSENDSDELSFFIEKCRRHNLKVTPQRIAIFRELTRSKDHPSAAAMFEAVRKQFPSISFDTVNRTLLTFAEMGLADIVEGYRGVRRFDPEKGNHHHLHCTRCSRIIDFRCEDYDNLPTPEKIRNKFTILGKRVVLNILCDKCKSRQR